MRTTRMLCMTLTLLFGLFMVCVVGARAEALVAPLTGTQVACASCGLGNVIDARLAAAAPVLSLDDERLEYGPVVSISPKRVGTGAAISWRLLQTASGKWCVWGDGGVLKYNEKTDQFLGLSTNVPLGRTLTENGRIGVGGLLRARDVFSYLRYTLKF